MTNHTDLGRDAQDAFFAEEWLQWIGEAFGASGFGVSGTALVITFAAALGLYNWTESFKVPAVWLALTTPLIAATLPAPVAWRLVGVITTAVATIIIGLFMYWRRL